MVSVAGWNSRNPSGAICTPPTNSPLKGNPSTAVIGVSVILSSLKSAPFGKVRVNLVPSAPCTLSVPPVAEITALAVILLSTLTCTLSGLGANVGAADGTATREGVTIATAAEDDCGGTVASVSYTHLTLPTNREA